jgi:hypothetical protein
MGSLGLRWAAAARPSPPQARLARSLSFVAVRGRGQVLFDGNACGINVQQFGAPKRCAKRRSLRPGSGA